MNAQDGWYGGADDDVHVATTGDDEDLLHKEIESNRYGATNTKFSQMPNMKIELTYFRSRLPKFLGGDLQDKREASAIGTTSKGALGGVEGLLAAGRRQLTNAIPTIVAGSPNDTSSTIVVPVKSAECSMAVASRNRSEALQAFKQAQMEKKANREAMDGSKSTVAKLFHRLDVEKGVEELTDEEKERLARKARAEAYRTATREERRALERDERTQETFTVRNNNQAAEQAKALNGGGEVMDERLQILRTRRRLPIYKSREQLVQCIRNNPVCIIQGETGSGKTTQLVQYLLEEGFAGPFRPGAAGPIAEDVGIIACTQPRKVAAVGVAKRVADEVGCTLGTGVGYAIRLEDCSDPTQTKIKFMTEGVLLRELMSDPLCLKYSVVVLDEAHERSVNTDVLLGLLKVVLRQRTDLRLIVTSATMNVEKFSLFFGEAPIFIIPGKTFEVDVVYQPVPVADYIEEIVNKVAELHITNPLRFPPRGEGEEEEGVGADILVFLSGKEEILAVMDMVKNLLETRVKSKADTLMMVPLYSELSPAEQLKALIPTPEGMRKCVVSTNVAETSLTIDGIRFVVDSGFMKTNVFRPKIGMNTLLMYPVSQAEANQRKGRAGRTARGVCCRVYTQQQFEDDLLPSAVPEIQRSCIDSVVLLLKNLGIEDPAKFDFVDPPPAATLWDSQYKLWLLGALDAATGRITPLGRQMVEFPVDPTLARMIVASVERGCSEQMVSIAAMMSVDMRTLSLNPLGKEEEAKQERRKFNVHESDHLTLLNIYMQFVRSGKSRSWAEDNFLDYRTLMRAVDIRVQFVDRMRSAKLRLRSSGQQRRGDQQPNHDVLGDTQDWISGGTIAGISDSVRQCLAFGYITQVAKRTKWTEYESLASAVNCFIAPTSAVLDSPTMPEYVVYHEFLLTSKEYMRVVTVVEPEWIVEAACGVVEGLCADGSVLKYEDLAAAIHDAKQSNQLDSLSSAVTAKLGSAAQASNAASLLATLHSIQRGGTPSSSMPNTMTSGGVSSSRPPSSNTSTAPPRSATGTQPAAAGLKRRRAAL